MTEELARQRATERVLQRYHLSDLDEAQRALTPAQYEGVLREIADVEAHLLTPANTRRPSARTPGITTPLGRVPPVTALLLASIWVVFVLENVYPGGISDAMFVAFGAVTPDVFATHQLWRLVFSCFLHVSFYHIISNSIGLIWLGSVAETLYGPLRYLAIYLAAGVGGNVLVVVTQNSGVGASGAILGLLGALLAGFWRNRAVIDTRQSRQMFSGLAITLALNLFTGLLPGISWQAHLGGAATGGVLGLIIPFRSPRYSRAVVVAANGLGIVLIIGAVGLAVSYVGVH